MFFVFIYLFFHNFLVFEIFSIIKIKCFFFNFCIFVCLDAGTMIATGIAMMQRPRGVDL